MYFIIKRHKIDIVHLNAKLISVLPGILASRLAGVPCICHLHDIKQPVKREIIFSSWVDYFVVLTQKAEKFYKEFFSKVQTKMIPNGIDPSDYDLVEENGYLRKDFSLSPDDKVIGIVGRLVEGKGFKDFISAAAIVSKKYENVKFLIVGSAQEESSNYEKILKEIVISLNLVDKVIFTGWREDIKQIIASFDILVQASSTFPEGFGLTVIEAMMLRKPVIVTNIPGPSELVVNGVTGIIVPPSNKNALAQAMSKLISEPELSMEMGKRGRERAVEKFDVNKTVRSLELLYRSLAKEG